MIILFKLGPAFGLPDPSPFVMKVETLLKMANLLYRADNAGFAEPVNVKIPYIDDGGVVVADPTFVRWHIERKYRIDFDHGLNAARKATAWAFEKMVENQLSWVGMQERGMIAKKFPQGPVRFFDKVSAPIRPIVMAVNRRKLQATPRDHDLERLSSEEIQTLATRSINAIADFLGDKPFFMGTEPTGADATMFAFACAVLCPYFEPRLRCAAERRENLRRYVGRMTARYYPGLKELSGCRAAA